jgi:hypothetical protein
VSNWKEWAARVVFGLIGLLFVYAGWIQLNDPDPLLWVATYLVAAIFCFFAAARRPLPAPVVGTYGAITAAWAIWLASIVFGGGEVRQMFPDQEKTGMVIVDTEEGREMGGLTIITLAMVGLVAYERRRRKDDE